MTTITVWLLVMVGFANSGGLGAVEPFMFPTVEDCEHVARSAPKISDRANMPKWRCIQARVVVRP